MKRSVLAFLALALAAGLVASQVRGCARRSIPPNAIIITLDTVRADHLSVYNYYRDTTPRLAEFARDGAVFTRHYTPVPSTWPSHFALMTSRPPSLIGVLHNGQRPLDTHGPMLAEHLSTRGYQTAAVAGSAVFLHTGGLERGFDYFDNKIGSGRGGRRRDLVWTKPERYSRRAEEVVSRGIKWLERRDPDRPFFLWLHVWDAHGPYYCPDEHLNLYKTDPTLLNIMRERNQAGEARYFGKNLITDEAINQYDGSIHCLDQELGRFFAYLRDKGLYDSSLIVITADHGEGLMEHGYYGHGANIYESTVHIPLIIHLPGAKNAGRRSDQITSIMDLAPTIVSVLGQPPMPNTFGQDLTGTMAGQPLPKRTFALQSVDDRGFRKAPRPIMQGMVDPGWKYILFEDNEALFDLDADPHELRNLLPDAAGAERDRLAGRLSEHKKHIESLRTLPGQDLSEMDQVLRSLGY